MGSQTVMSKSKSDEFSRYKYKVNNNGNKSLRESLGVFRSSDVEIVVLRLSGYSFRRCSSEADYTISYFGIGDCLPNNLISSDAMVVFRRYHGQLVPFYVEKFSGSSFCRIFRC
ncbi:hypothetical protein E3N88_04339 [Mikania micrantha]|uniref:Uncharacterized protein n=1 Tax=Mikania micrantha TaxID=192012 RepID=A0A5N6PWA5_9ASTR|nr:hypothetical protein E3N88_04339 [Mikania micrantha]